MLRILEFIKSHNIKYISILIISYLTVWFLRIPVFGTNDDPAIIFMISNFFDESSEKIILSHYLIGHIFNYLYDQFGSINWYPIIYYLIQCLAVSFLLVNIFKKFKIKDKLSITIAILAIFLPVFISLQFTTVAYICGISALVGITIKSEESSTTKYRILAWSFFILATMIRWEASLSLLLFWSIFYIYTFIRFPRISVFYPLVLLITIVAVVRTTDILYYNDEGINYQVYQDNLETLMNHPIKEDRNLIIKKVEWSENDYLLLQNWFWIDNNIYSKEKIARIAPLLQGRNKILDGLYFLKCAILSLQQFSLILILSVCIFFIHFKLRNYSFLILSIIWLSFILIGLVLFAKLPFRVFYPMILSFFFIQFFFCEYRNTVAKQNYINLFLAAIIGVSVLTLIAKYYQNILPRKEYKTIMNYFNSQSDNTFVIRGGGQIPMEYAPMNISPQSYSKKNVIFTGWHIYSNPYQSFLKNRNIKNLMIEIINNPNFILVDPPLPELHQFIKDHYEFNVEFKKIALSSELNSIESLKRSYYIINNSSSSETQDDDNY